MAPVTICVVGAGALGLTAVKAFLEDGFHVTGFESRPYLGGLWKDSHDSTISVHATTVFNSSKWRSAFSDFPFNDEADTYPSAMQILHYLENYADHFSLREHYKLSTKVINIEYNGNRWTVTVQDLLSGQYRTHHFDKVCIATGAFHHPRWPKLENIESFKGQVIHSIDFHGGGEEYRNQNILIVGLHATAQDVCCALAAQSAKHVYMAHRRGVLLLPRFLPDGSPFDTSGTLKITFIMTFMNQYFSTFFWWMMDRMLFKQSKRSFPDIPQGLIPAPSVAVRTPLMADALWSLLKSGVAEPVSPIRRISDHRSVELLDGRVLEDIDAIIYCTGYNFGLPKDLVKSHKHHPYPPGRFDKEPLLYRNIFPMHEDERIRTSLAYLGHGYITLPGFIQFEMSAAAISQIWKTRTPLPPLPEMRAWHAENINRRKHFEARYKPENESTFYPILLDLSDQLRWLDWAAGAGLYKNMSNSWLNWRAWKMWWQDRQFYYLVLKGIFTPVLWRLFQTEKRRAMPWDECRQMIISENQRAELDRRTRLRLLQISME